MSVLLLLRSRPGILTTNDPGGRQAPHRVPRGRNCGSPYALASISRRYHQLLPTTWEVASSGVNKKGVCNWLDDITIPTRTFEEQLELLRETFDCVRQSKWSVNLPKSEFYFSVAEWLGMIIDRFGIRSAPNKIEAITHLSQPSTVEEVRVLLGMAGYLRKLVPNYSSVLAPSRTSFATHASAARRPGA